MLATVGIDLLSATNPENGTVTYTYNSDHTLATKVDANGSHFSYTYDGLKRLTQIKVGTTVLRTFIYDSNTLDSTYSGSYTQGRPVAVQNQGFTPNGYLPGNGGSNMTVPQQVTFTEMYAYTQPGLTSGKRLQVQEKFDYYVNNVHEQSTQTMNLDGAYTFDNEGKMTSVNYPTTKYYNQGQWNTTTGPTYTYSFDAMSRPTGLTDQNNTTDVSNVSYNAANQLLGITYFGKNETRTYNTLNQMTNVTIGSTMNITYTFPTANNNNGKISSSTDAISGETVTYQYDTLNRLLSASSSKGWSETYGFDGFGNLLSKTPTGGAPTLSQAVNAATNRIVGQNYDANGSQTSSATGTLTYDAENRVLTAASNGIQYAYDSRNKRIWSATMSGANMTQVLSYYGVDGQKLGTYTVLLGAAGPGPAVLMGTNAGTLAVFFGGKRIGVTSGGGGISAFTQDRLGSNGSYYPYGEAHGTVPQDQVGFATYTNDSATGLQYADQRYYASNWGRFMSPDKANAAPPNPGSWNRYPYVQGDPTNNADPRGLFSLAPEEAPSPGGEGGSGGDGASQGGCIIIDGVNYGCPDNPCAPSGDGFQAPDPAVCPGDPQPPGQPPTPPPPICSITLYARGTPTQFPLANHTYLTISDPASGIVDLLEGVPTRKPKFPNPFGGNWGTLFGNISGTDPLVYPGTKAPLPGDRPGPTQFVASDIGGANVCNLVDEILWTVQDYDAGVRVSYRPLPTQASGTYNSNSFTYTLLWDVGLIGPGGFPQPSGWTPGWGLLVPGLTF